jgi:hypothetical protein
VARPTYENSDHLNEERRVIEAVEATHGIRMAKTPKYYHIDFCGVDHTGRVVGWFEVRNKSFEKNRFQTFYTSLEKYLSVARMGHLTNLPAFIVCGWRDKIEAHKVKHTAAREYPLTIGGRTVNTRNDPDDIEPVIHIPLAHFQPLEQMFR